LTETLLLSFLAGAIGLVVGQWGLHAILALAPRTLPRAGEIGLDGRVLAFALVLATVSGIVFGLSGARSGTRANLADTLRGGGRGVVGPRRSLELLVLGETAFAVVLLAGAGLLLASFARLRAVDPGFEPSGVLAVRLASLPERYRGEGRRVELEGSILDRVRALPGVKDAAAVANFPLERGINLPVSIAGRPEDREGSVEWRGITPGYFETLRIPIVRGRAFTAADGAGAAKVAIVNAAFAERYWPGRNPIGERIEIGRWKGEWLAPEFEGGEEIVGVAADVKEIGLGADARRTVYVPRAQAPAQMLDNPRLVIRADRAAAAESAIVGEIRRLDPEIRPPTVRLLDEIVSASIAQPRFQTLLLGLFAGMALVLTAFGIYAVIAYTVQQRVPEMGIRLALGASPAQVLRLVLRRAMAPVGLGLVIGIGAALALTRLLSSMLYGVTPTDPATFAAVGAVFFLVGLAAAFIPAQRAARVSPTVSLSAE
jgi:predicted permease